MSYYNTLSSNPQSTPRDIYTNMSKTINIDLKFNVESPSYYKHPFKTDRTTILNNILKKDIIALKYKIDNMNENNMIAGWTKSDIKRLIEARYKLIT